MPLRPDALRRGGAPCACSRPRVCSAPRCNRRHRAKQLKPPPSLFAADAVLCRPANGPRQPAVAPSHRPQRPPRSTECGPTAPCARRLGSRKASSPPLGLAGCLRSNAAAGALVRGEALSRAYGVLWETILLGQAGGALGGAETERMHVWGASVKKVEREKSANTIGCQIPMPPWNSRAVVSRPIRQPRTTTLACLSSTSGPRLPQPLRLVARPARHATTSCSAQSPFFAAARPRHSFRSRPAHSACARAHGVRGGTVRQ